MRPWLVPLVVLLFSALTLAQDDACPDMQNQALANVAAHCAEQADGSLCLGHGTLSAIPRAPAQSAPRMILPGDSIPIDSIDWLSVSTEDHGWGLARAVFPAYPQDGLEAEPSALLTFGNVALFFPEPREAPEPLIDLAVTASRGAYLRAQPNIESDIVKPIAVRARVKAIGASPSRNWLRVYAAPDTIGWMSSEVLTEPAGALPVIHQETDLVPLWLPWQAFDFHSGIHDAPCQGSLESGILLQTPKYIAPRHFIINGIRLWLSGTAWLQSQVKRGSLIHVLDGLATVSAAGTTHEVAGGFMTTTPLELSAESRPIPSAAPSAPSAYDYQALLSLPVHLLIYPGRVRIDVYTVADPVPAGGGNPLEGMSTADDCKIAALLDGANLRSRPDPAAPIIAVMAYRESAKPISRGIGADGLPWWKLAESVWVRTDATGFNGDCDAVKLDLPGS